MLQAMKSFFLVIGLSLTGFTIFSQGYNPDPNRSYVNISLAKTPESQGFEKYGNYKVNEITGSPDVSISLYTVQSRTLSAPISLSYKGGIRVNQEATWVGLGFDLMFGGRITREVKGRIDNLANADNLGMSAIRTHAPAIFNRLGNSNNRDILTVASPCEGFADCATNTNYDYEPAIRSMAVYGLGEPDIFTANFNGNSFKFYFDLVDGSLKFLGEKNFFKVYTNADQYGKVISWEIVDTKGVSFYFNQQEISRVANDPGYDMGGGSSTTAWLLTKMQQGIDSIVFRYTSYGEVEPAYEWQARLTGSYGGTMVPSADHESSYNRMILTPSYLTQIESNTTLVNFYLSTRSDIQGQARKLDEINITDKITGETIKKWLFNYDYFVGNVHPLWANKTTDEKNWSRLRLKLRSLVSNNEALQQPYKFYYDTARVVIPSKYTLQQDHWGYLNHMDHTNIYSPNPTPQQLIPHMTSLSNEGVEPAPPAGVLPPNYPAGADRTCHTIAVLSMTMDSMVYPTGGSTKFIYGPHHSSYYSSNPNLVGGGIRIDTIKNYDGTGKLASRVNYSYEGGVYLGSINYLNIYYTVGKGVQNGGTDQSPTRFTLSANGTYNKNDLLIAYAKVTKKFIDASNQANNGSVVKYFMVTPSSLMNSLKPQLVGPHYPATCIGGGTCVSTEQFYNPYYCLPPTPREDLDGKLYKEEYLDNTGAILRSVDYYYKQVDYSQNLYSIKVKDNVEGGIEVQGPLPYPTSGTMNGWRRYLMVLSPAKSYFTHLDSVIEKTYQGANFIQQKKANTYDAFHQVEFESTYHSDGTQTIVHTITARSFPHPSVPGGGDGDAALIETMRSTNRFDLPLEQTVIKRMTTGDSLVINSIYYAYKFPTSLHKAFVLATNTPLTWRTQFVPIYYLYNYPTLPSFYLIKDSRYLLQDSADYSADYFAREVHSVQGKKSFIWDETYNTIMAQCLNAVQTEMAASSFETNAKGNWTYSGSPNPDPTAPTGRKIYKLTGTNNIIKTGLTSTANYIISYWIKGTTALSITGTVVGYPISGSTVNGWKYFEHKITGQTQVTITGSESIDELRLYPEKSLMSTYTYEPLIGIRTQCDPVNRISYYKYDGAGRLTLTLDQNKNIVQKNCYNYSGQPENCSFYFNTYQEGTFVRNTGTCPAGTVGGVATYSVAAGTYYSAVSVADANEIAIDEIAGNGQAYADATAACIPSYYFTACCGFTSVYSSFGSPSAGVANFSLVFYKQSGTVVTGTSYQIGTLSGMYLPSVPRGTIINEGGRNWLFTILPSGYISIKLNSGPVPTGQIQLNGTYNL